LKASTQLEGPSPTTGELDTNRSTGKQWLRRGKEELCHSRKMCWEQMNSVTGCSKFTFIYIAYSNYAKQNNERYQGSSDSKKQAFRKK
jgi:hypothetical protein